MSGDPTGPTFPAHERLAWMTLLDADKVRAAVQIGANCNRVRRDGSMTRVRRGETGKTSDAPRGEGNECRLWQWEGRQENRVIYHGRWHGVFGTLKCTSHEYTAVHADELGDILDRLAALEEWRAQQEDDGR